MPTNTVLQGFKVIIVSLALLVGGQAFAEQNALLIGMSTPSRNSDISLLASDLRDIVASLEAADINAELLQDRDIVDIQTAMIAYLRQSSSSEGRIIYITGAVVSVNGENYLLPSSAGNTIQSAIELSYNALHLNPIIAQLGLEQTPSLLVLDTNYAHNVDRTLQRNGLAAATDFIDLSSLPSNVSILTATASGRRNVARSNGDNDFSQSFADALSEAGLDVHDFMAKVKNQTSQDSRNRQVPTVFEGSDRFALGQAPQPQFTEAEFQIYQVAIQNGTNEALESFLNLFPQSIFADDVRQRLDALQPQEILQPIGEDYIVVRRSNLRDGPGTNFARVGTLEANELVYVEGRVQGERWYKLRTSSGQVAYIFDTLVTPYAGSELQVWTDAQRNGSIDSYQNYLNQFPAGTFADAAEQQIIALLASQRQAALAPYQITPRSGRLIVTRNANIRDLPDAVGNRLDTLSAGSVLVMTGQSQVVDWYQIDYQGQVAFIWGKLVEPFEGSVYEAWSIAQADNSITEYRNFLAQWPGSVFEQNARRAIAAIIDANTWPSPRDANQLRLGFYPLLDDVVLRSRTNNRGSVVARLDQGSLVEVISISNNRRWVQLSGQFGIGWITSDALVQSVDTPSPVANNRRAADLIYSISAREEPGFDQNTAKRLQKGARVVYDQVTSDGFWARVVSEPESPMWVPISAVIPQDPPVFIGDNVTTREVDFRERNYGYGYLRRIGRTEPVVGTLDMGTIVEVITITADGRWVGIVKSDGTKGWLPTISVRRATAADKAAFITPINARFIATSELRVFQNQNLTTQIHRIFTGATINVLGSLDNGRVFQIQHGNNGVAYVSAADTTAYEGSSKQAFDRAKQAGSAEALQRFLIDNPNSFFREQAIEELRNLVGKNELQFNLGGINFTLR